MLNMEEEACAEEGASDACVSDVCPSADCQADSVHDDLRNKWQQKQDELKSNLQTEDCDVIKAIMERIDNPELSDRPFYIGGVDISFVKEDNVNACAALVVVSFPELKVVYEDYRMVKLTAPYIAGFLAFREADFLVDLVNTLREVQPEFLPHVIMVDGNGRLHVRGFGLACHLGVLLDLPCIGVAKTLYQVDGLEKNAERTTMMKERLKKGGDSLSLVGQSGVVHGKALRSHDSSTNPIYISQGHKVSLDSCVKLVHSCCQYRIPEPVRKADINSREYLRENFPAPNTEDSEPTNVLKAESLKERGIQQETKQTSESEDA